MPLKFGTSGLRGLVSDMTDDTIAHYTRAFLTACDSGTVLCVGRDLRPSSPRIANTVIAAARGAGMPVLDCGALPTPALALAANAKGGGAVMVTGSHIPSDRNGLKFYTRSGEITKTDEAAIQAALSDTTAASEEATLERDHEAAALFKARYETAFGATALAGKRIGLYAHSAVGRDMLSQILTDLGADVIDLGRSDNFIPVDTEAVDTNTRAQIKAWVDTHGLCALVSTDGDSDRPLLADETGRVVPGDLLGQITADLLQAETIVTPISSNSGVAHKGFEEVRFTQIGSPYVIADMKDAGGAVVGYEANGGFLLGFTAQGPTGPIEPLMTRDCILPILAVLYAARQGGVAARVAQEPPVTTLSDRLQDVPQEVSQPLIAQLSENAAARATFLAAVGRKEAELDMTDGVRMICNDRSVVHIRPSGNAPELRLYIEAETPETAHALMTEALAQLRRSLL